MHYRSTLLNIAVFFLPGLLLLIYLCSVFTEIREKVLIFWDTPKISGVVLIALICFIAGGFIEFLRLIVAALIQGIIGRIQWIIGLIKKRSDNSAEKLKVFRSLTNRTSAYQRLICNISISILLVWIFSVSESWISLVSLQVVFFVACLGAILAIIIFSVNEWKMISRLYKTRQENKDCKGA